MVSQPNLSKAIIKTKICNVTFEKYSTKTGDVNTISDHSCQNSNKIHPMAGTSKYKLFRKSPTSSFLLKFHFGEKKHCLAFSKFEQCSNCGQNTVLSSYKMYLRIVFIFICVPSMEDSIICTIIISIIIFDKKNKKCAFA